MEFVKTQKLVEDAEIKVVIGAEKVADGGLVESLAAMQKRGDGCRRIVAVQALGDQESDALLRVHVELFPR